MRCQWQAQSETRVQQKMRVWQLLQLYCQVWRWMACQPCPQEVEVKAATLVLLLLLLLLLMMQQLLKHMMVPPLCQCREDQTVHTHYMLCWSSGVVIENPF